jgi:hypothetical protein
MFVKKIKIKNILLFAVLFFSIFPFFSSKEASARIVYKQFPFQEYDFIWTAENPMGVGIQAKVDDLQSNYTYDPLNVGEISASGEFRPFSDSAPATSNVRITWFLEKETGFLNWERVGNEEDIMSVSSAVILRNYYFDGPTRNIPDPESATAKFRVGYNFYMSMENGDYAEKATVYKEFTVTDKYVVSVEKNGTGNGTVSGPGINCGSSCQASFNRGAYPTFSARADVNSVFVGWSGDCSGRGDCTLDVRDDKNITATFNCAPRCNSGSVCGGESNGCGGFCPNKPDSVWNPDPSTVCFGELFIQNGNCGGVRQAIGTKDCSCVPDNSCQDVCEGMSCWNGCEWDQGSKVCNSCIPDCSCASNTNIGQFCYDGCAGLCPGTKVCTSNPGCGDCSGGTQICENSICGFYSQPCGSNNQPSNNNGNWIEVAP